MNAPAIDTGWIADLVAGLRSRQPRVHCITNHAAQAFTANVLLAAGAIPSLTIAVDEIEHFVGRSDALLVNLGTLSETRRQAICLAVAAAAAKGAPIVLDPVMVDLSPPRRAFALDLLGDRPAILRCNAREFTALSGAPAEDANLAAFAGDRRIVVATSGDVDRVSDGERLVSVANGHPLLTRITAAGCALGALMAAFAAVEPDPFKAAEAGLVLIGVAGAEAGKTAAGPGSFAVGLIDALAALTPETIAAEARLA